MVTCSLDIWDILNFAEQLNIKIPQDISKQDKCNFVNKELHKIFPDDFKEIVIATRLNILSPEILDLPKDILDVINNYFSPKITLGTYPNGNLMKFEQIVNDVLEGEQKDYHENEVLKSRFLYKKGKIEGLAESWYDNGNISVREFYINNLREGEHKEWYPNGVLQKEEFFKNNLLEGKKRQFYDNGQISIQNHRKNGNLEGEWKEWYRTGEIGVICFFENGFQKGPIKRWNINGDLTVE